MYIYSEYFKAEVYTIWVHRPLGKGPKPETLNLLERLSDSRTDCEEPKARNGKSRSRV